MADEGHKKYDRGAMPSCCVSRRFSIDNKSIVGECEPESCQWFRQDVLPRFTRMHKRHSVSLLSANDGEPCLWAVVAEMWASHRSSTEGRRVRRSTRASASARRASSHRRPLAPHFTLVGLRPLLQLDDQGHRLTTWECNRTLIGSVRRAGLRETVRDGELRDLGGQFQDDSL